MHLQVVKTNYTSVTVLNHKLEEMDFGPTLNKVHVPNLDYIYFFFYKLHNINKFFHNISINWEKHFTKNSFEKICYDESLTQKISYCSYPSKLL